MFSGRFDGGAKERYLRQTAAELAKFPNVEVLVVQADAGEFFGQQTMDFLYQSDIMVAMACARYGEMTDSSYCTYYELKYCKDYRKPVLPIQLYDGPWPPRPDAAAAALNSFCFPPDLVRVKAIDKSPTELAACIFEYVMKMPVKDPVAAKKKDEVSGASTRRPPRRRLASRHQVSRASTRRPRRRCTSRHQASDMRPTRSWGSSADLQPGADREREAELQLLDAEAWATLGRQGGGEAGGRQFTRKQCYENALAMDPAVAWAWAALARLGGGDVGRKKYTAQQCAENGVRCAGDEAAARKARETLERVREAES